MEEDVAALFIFGLGNRASYFGTDIKQLFFDPIVTAIEMAQPLNLGLAFCC
jgi:hypothetical protein